MSLNSGRSSFAASARLIFGCVIAMSVISVTTSVISILLEAEVMCCQSKEKMEVGMISRERSIGVILWVERMGLRQDSIVNPFMLWPMLADLRFTENTERKAYPDAHTGV